MAVGERRNGPLSWYFAPKRRWLRQTLAYLMVVTAFLVCISLVQSEKNARETGLAKQIATSQYEQCLSAAAGRQTLRDVVILSTSNTSFDPTVIPGWTDLTPGEQRFFLALVSLSGSGDSSAFQKRLLDRIPIPKCGRPPKGYKTTTTTTTTTTPVASTTTTAGLEG